mmetsp:Transcript_21632/g.69857  ORF Transcript_21632/g.69857 Transcript_21632/m.69857 type:complete len:359 (+) Transcript_21632:1548-2624(+)
MKAALASGFGEPLQVLSVRPDGMVRPKLSPDAKSTLLIRVLACSLSPSDWRTLSGDARLIKKPAAFPYVPGGDVCGVVEEVHPEEPQFKVGDVVVGTWTLFGENGLAEYYLLDSKMATKKPEGMSAVHAAAIANSLVHAHQTFKQAELKPGDRVLVLGGSGGMGSLLCQLVRCAGASYVAATSTDPELMSSLGVDKCIDHTQERWADVAEWKQKPFDLVIDCAEGVAAWRACLAAGMLKPAKDGGRWVCVVLSEWDIHIVQWFHICGFFCPVLGRLLKNKLGRALSGGSWAPAYSIHLGGPESGADIAAALDLVTEGKVKPVIDSRSPHPFTSEGVKHAFELLRQRGGHGKIVITVCE